MILRFPGRPPTHNAERRKHWSSGAKLTDAYRKAAYAMTLSKTRRRPFPPEGRITVDVYQVCRRRPLADAGAMFDVAKAVVDGAVKDGKIRPDDGPDHLAWLRFHAPELGDRDELIIEILQETT